jgi:hypothetical protein
MDLGAARARPGKPRPDSGWRPQPPAPAGDSKCPGLFRSSWRSRSRSGSARMSVSTERPVDLVYVQARSLLAVRVAREDQKGDSAEELRLKNELGSELPIEPELERWLGLSDAPLD